MPLTTWRTIVGMSTYASVRISPATCTRPVVTRVSTATRESWSFESRPSRMLSEIWSQILSGCPSVTDSDVNRRRALIGDSRTGSEGEGLMNPFWPAPPTERVRGPRISLCVTQAELVLVDLVQRDRERLVLDRGVDERADVVEEVALVQIGVVVVDLTCALRRVDHELVLRVDAVEQVVDGGIDDALGVVS